MLNTDLILYAHPRGYASCGVNIKDQINNFEELKGFLQSGVLMGVGTLGPKHYAVEAMQPAGRQINGEALFGWPRGAEKVSGVALSRVFIRGCETIEKRSYVYFSLMESSDSRLFGVSFDSFQKAISQIFYGEVQTTDSGPSLYDFLQRRQGRISQVPQDAAQLLGRLEAEGAQNGALSLNRQVALEILRCLAGSRPLNNGSGND